MENVNDSTITVRLGVEELVFLLRLLGIETLPGLGRDPSLGLEEEDMRRSTAAGFNSLRARGWVVAKQIETGSAVVADTLLAALIGTCATARRVLYLNRHPVDAPPEANYVHFDQRLTVFHTLVGPGVHQMTGTISAGSTASTVARLMHIADQPAPASDSIEISRQTLDSVAAAVQEDDAARGVRALLEDGVSQDLAERLTAGVEHTVSNSIVMMVHLDEEGRLSSSDGFGLLETELGFWILRNPPGDDYSEDRLALDPVTAERCTDLVCSLIGQKGAQANGPHGTPGPEPDA